MVSWRLRGSIRRAEARSRCIAAVSSRRRFSRAPNSARSARDRDIPARSPLSERLSAGARMKAGQVGDFAFTGPTLTKVPGSLGWTQISAGATHTCAVRTDGALFCWGANDRGQLGNGGFAGNTGSDARSDHRAGRIRERGPAAHVRANHAGAVFCWGAVWTGRENGLEISRSQPTPQAGSRRPRARVAECWRVHNVWSGRVRIRVLLGSESARRDGQRDRGRIGDAAARRDGSRVRSGQRRHRADLRRGHERRGVLLGRRLPSASSASRHHCSSISVAVSGLPCSKVPVAVVGRQLFTEISTGPGSHSCGVTTRGNLYCWGLGLSGQRGDGTAAIRDLGPDSGEGSVSRDVILMCGSDGRTCFLHAPRSRFTDPPVRSSAFEPGLVAGLAIVSRLDSPRVSNASRQEVPTASVPRLHHWLVPRLRGAGFGRERRDSCRPARRRRLANSLAAPPSAFRRTRRGR